MGGVCVDGKVGAWTNAISSLLFQWNWGNVKENRIEGGGTRVFTLCDFAREEIVTVYVGTLVYDQEIDSPYAIILDCKPWLSGGEKEA